MSKAALFVLAVEVLAVCVLVHRIVTVVRDSVAAHRAKRGGSSNLDR